MQIIMIINFVLFVLVVFLWVLYSKTIRRCKQLNDEYETLRKKYNDNRIYSQNMNYLRLISYKKVNVKNLLATRDIKRIAIYGMGKMGKALLEEFQKYDVSVYCGIDKKEYPDSVLEIKQLKDVSNDMDIIIVTPESEFDVIFNQLREKVTVPIVRISEFLEELLRFPENIEDNRQ